MRPILTAFALSFVCGAALAQQSPETPAIAPGLLTVLSEYDVNSDGRVDTSEFVSLLPANLQTAARACDSDSDGTLSQAEYDLCAGLTTIADAEPAPR